MTSRSLAETRVRVTFRTSHLRRSHLKLEMRPPRIGQRPPGMRLKLGGGLEQFVVIPPNYRGRDRGDTSRIALKFLF